MPVHLRAPEKGWQTHVSGLLPEGIAPGRLQAVRPV